MDARPFTGEIYVHTCTLNEKSYVGQTTGGVSRRWCDQVKVSRWPRHPGYRYPLSRAIRKYGKDAFAHQILSVSQSKKELDNLEKIWIILLQTRAYGYNLAAGGEGNPGLSHTKESKSKISEHRKGKALGNQNAVGQIWSDERKQAMRQKLQGKTFSMEHNEKIRQARLGIPRPDISDANRQRWANPEAREKQRETLKAVNAGKLIRNAHGRIIGRKEQ